jgi:DNA-directed RNA polymerase II subunit RPB7
MFREWQLTEQIRIPPINLSSGIRETIDSELRNLVEGKVTAETGIILCITSIISTGVGFVSQRSGFAIFDVQYKGIVCCPRKDQIVDAIITSSNLNGFFAEAGPVEIFVAKKSLPEGFAYNLNTAAYENVQTSAVLQAHTIIRVKIISTKPNPQMTKLTAVATMVGEGLGLLGTGHR